MSTAESEPLSIAMLSHLASRQAPSGAEQSLALLARGLADRGHSVSVVVPGPWALDGRLATHGVRTIRIPSRVCWLTYHDPRSALETLLRWARYALPDPGGARLARSVARGGYDLVHVNCLPHLRGARAGRAAGLPVIWHLREILPAGPRRRWLARRLARNADRIVAVSEATAGWVRAEGLADRVEVIPNGVPLVKDAVSRRQARRELGLPEQACIVGQFGQLVPHKGALELLQAARLAGRDEPDLHFVLAGAGPRRFVDRLREAVGGDAVADRVRILPPEPDATRLLAAVDVVCLATTTPDPLPRAVLEGMAAGRPIAAFDSGGTGEMVQQDVTGRLVRRGDVRGLARVLVELARDPDLRQRLGAAGRERAAAEFSEEAHLDRMEDLFRRTVRR